MAKDRDAKMEVEASLRRFIEALKVFEGQLRELAERIGRVEESIDRFPRVKVGPPPTDRKP